MEPIQTTFEGLKIIVYGKEQPEYLPLPTQVDLEGNVLTCWRLSWKERLHLLLTGRLFLTCMTFFKPLQPIRFDFKPPVVKKGVIQ